MEVMYLYSQEIPIQPQSVNVNYNGAVFYYLWFHMQSESGRGDRQLLLIWDVESDSMKLFSPVAIHDAESESRHQGEEKEGEGGALEATLPELADSALHEQVGNGAK